MALPTPQLVEQYGAATLAKIRAVKACEVRG